jgi:ketol-acid reductoisomerase
VQEWALGMPMLHRLRRTAAESQMEITGKQWREDFGK